METSRVTFITLVCVVLCSQKRTCSAAVEMRVRRGDDVMLYSDCVWEIGSTTQWFRNCSEENHPRLQLSFMVIHNDYFSRYSFVFNVSTSTHNLLIQNITESDQGVYYCALHENNISVGNDRVIRRRDVYRYGNRSTRLSLLAEPNCSVCEPCVSEWSVSWILLLSVCGVCVLVSSLLSSVCVYCLCTHTTKVTAGLSGRDKMTTLRRDDVGEDEVWYTSLDIQNHKKKRKMMRRKKTVQHSDFSTYSEVRTESADTC